MTSTPSVDSKPARPSTFGGVFLLVLLGCAQGPLRTPTSRHEHATARPTQITRSIGAAWHRSPAEAVEQQPVVEAIKPLDPTTLLDWPAPPATVGCLVRGTGNPFPDRCSSSEVQVHQSGFAVAQVDVDEIELVLGIPRRTGGRDLWVHARGGGFAATGNAEMLRFRVQSEVAVVKDRVWAKKGAPVIPRYADVGVSVAIQDEFLGVSDVMGSLACADLRFDPPPRRATVAIFGAAAPAADTPMPVIRYPRLPTLALFREPNGSLITTLRSREVAVPLSLSLQLHEQRAGFARVSFDTRNARFDVWVASESIGEEATGFHSSMSGCGSSGGRTTTMSTLVRETSAIHLGLEAPSTLPARGLQVAAGTAVVTGESKNGFVSVTPLGSPIGPPMDQQFWLPENVLGP